MPIVWKEVTLTTKKEMSPFFSRIGDLNRMLMLGTLLIDLES